MILPHPVLPVAGYWQVMEVLVVTVEKVDQLWMGLLPVMEVVVVAVDQEVAPLKAMAEMVV